MDISETESNELSLSEIIDKSTSPLHILQKILVNNVGDVCTNVTIALRIILSLSVTTTMVEIYFLKLK